MQKLYRTKTQSEKGISSVEFAVVMPLLMLVLFVVMVLSIHGFSVLAVATGVPLEARASGSGIELLSVFETTAAAGAPVIGGAPICQRAVLAQLDSAPIFQFPMLPEAPMRMHAGSVARNWQFYAGPPQDGCN